MYIRRTDLFRGKVLVLPASPASPAWACQGIGQGFEAMVKAMKASGSTQGKKGKKSFLSKVRLAKAAAKGEKAKAATTTMPSYVNLS